jgi:glucose-6-phosphate 1-dehydrogenase
METSSHTLRGHRAPPCAMVIFGASGDLTKRLLMPALYNLARARRLSEHFAVIGVDRSEWSEDNFRAHLAEGVRSFVSDTGGAGPAPGISSRRG